MSLFGMRFFEMLLWQACFGQQKLCLANQKTLRSGFGFARREDRRLFLSEDTFLYQGMYKAFGPVLGY
ncbi:hypothetical protein [Atopobium deltae]|uniref:hypothetical protein n=1 Tax=Atopobium deltae TaxID=1393034 RepID=UPI00082BF8D0|nr:hypothetical protein [Atopobium deltae]